MKIASPRKERTVLRRTRLAGAFVFACTSACLLLTADFSSYAGPLQSSSAPSQAQIGAAFVFNFAKFTEWPPQTLPNAMSPVTVCFVGAEDIRAAFQSITAGKDVNGHPVLVRNAKAAAEVRECQVVYVDASSSAVLMDVLKNARQSCTLAIGTSEDFLTRGGIIRLLVENNRMRFDVNVGAAGRTKIHLSSKLLALARSVVDLPDPGGN
jgi:hypothetical protein